jgi:hypothetical protein
MENKDEEAIAPLLSEAATAIQKCIDMLEQYSDRQNQRNKKDADAASAAYESARTLMLVLSGLAILIGAIAAVGITRRLLQQLGGEPDYAAEIAGRIGAGDLTVAVDIIGVIDGIAFQTNILALNDRFHGLDYLRYHRAAFGGRWNQPGPANWAVALPWSQAKYAISRSVPLQPRRKSRL